MSGHEHILLVRLSSVGDVLLATPVAARLRSIYPSAMISWLVDPPYRDLVRGNPDIDQVVSFDYTYRHQGPVGIRRLAWELKPVDLMVDLQHKMRTSLLATYLRPKEHRSLVKRRGLGVIKALVGKDTVFGAPHQVERFLRVLSDEDEELSKSPLPRLRIDENDLEAAERLVGKRHRESPLVGIFPSARHPTKRWPVKYLGSLADRCRQAGLGVALLGGEEDEPITQAVVDSMTVAPSLVQTGGSLGLLGGIISLCAGIVSPDSGPAHMAAALGVGVVTLFGPTSPERWAPPGPKSRIARVDLPCSPCSNYGGPVCPLGTLECMRALQPELVWQAVVNVLDLKTC